ncbi:MAG: YiiD C-terminal domain-containing protein [Nitrosomonadales bacterium]|nr:YiiD C-terminal domain-containing protein [Nitrosomonadales bacterium]
MSWLTKLLPERMRESLWLRLFGLARIPLLFYVGVSVVELSPERMVVRIPLRRRNKNHLGSMYFGALCIGADVAPGAYTMYLIRQQPVRISMVFKDFQAEFLKRAEGDVHFTCEQGKEIAELVAQAAASEERVERQLGVIATVPSLSDEPVARFKLTISLKRRA